MVQEVVVQGSGRAGAAELQQMLGQSITVVTPNPQTLQQFRAALPTADREVLAVAQEKAVDHIITGDEALVREAVLQGLTCISVAEVVVLLKREGLIPNVGPVLDQMRQNGFGISNTLYQRALQVAGE